MYIPFFNIKGLMFFEFIFLNFNWLSLFEISSHFRVSIPILLTSPSQLSQRLSFFYIRPSSSSSS